MKSKKYLLVVLSVLILFLFITSASAAEANETDVISIDESINLENNLLSADNNVKSNDILKSSNDELLTAGNDWYVNSSKDTSGDGKSEKDAFKTLNESLNEAQDGDTIWIASGEYTGNDNIGLTIAKNLNFIKNGDGEAIFDAENSGNIWTVNSTSIYITGLTFKNGNSTNGSAIYISHEVKSNINATFINNTASNRGGAIYIVSGGISGTLNGVFINNTASDWGGAIYIDSGGISGNVNGTFINNKGSSGSAIFIAGDISGNVNGTFINNEAKSRGAIYIYNGDASGNINGTFINNVANQGGAIAVGDAGKISGNVNGIFINNTGYHSGGAISIDETESYSTGKVDGIFINNKAEEGGAIYIEFTYDDPNVSLGGTFINNNASRGGAIFINQLVNAITIQDSIFLNNGDVLSDGMGSYIKTIDCWFGNNATNYNSRPDAGNAVMDGWLFLNATANPTDVSVDQNSIITFKLDSYDNSSGEIKSYDASKMKFILDFTQTLGELDKTSALIGENITYTARQGGNSAVTGKYETGSYTIELNNVKIPTEINVTDSTIALNAGGEVDVGATLTPADAGNLTYTSNNTNVVVVENGKIKSIKKGNATITVSFAGDERYATAKNKTISVIVSLNDANVVAENMELKVSESGVINYTTTPEGLKVSFVADNSGIVSVDKDGTVKALKNGTAEITINVGDDEVYAKNSTVITVTVTLNDASVVAEDMELNVSDSGVINYTTSPDGLNVTFVADNSGVVSVDEDGTVKALKEGKANITVKVGDDKVYAKNSTVITVTVSKIPTKINVNNHTLDFGVDDTADSVAELSPSDAGKLNFTSSDEKVVVVDANGTFTAIGTGSANVTVSFKGNNRYAAAESKIIYVTVSKIPTSIFVSNATIDMTVDSEVDPGVSITPFDAGKLNFTSSDVSVVRVDGNGKFIGVGIGNAIVTVSFDGNNKFEAAESKNITVTVTKIPTSIVVVNSTVDMNVGDEVDPGISISPSGAGELDYVSSDVSVVRVDGDGTFIGVATGSATVTVRFLGDEKYSAAESKNITVTVTKIPTSIVVVNSTVGMNVGDEVDPGVSIVPSGAGELDYVSSDVSVVRVDGDGTLIAVGAGSATVTVRFLGDEKYSAAESKNITVAVTLNDASVVAKDMNMAIGDNVSIIYSTVPAGLNVTFVADNSGVVSVSNAGVVTALKTGVAKITIRTGDNKKYALNSTVITVTVKLHDASVSVNKSSLNLELGDTIDIVATTYPAGLNVTYVPDNSGVVRVDEKGKITALKVGSAVITVKVGGDGVYAENSTTVTVTVSKISTKIAASSVTTVYNVNKNLVITLKDSKGNPISGVKISVNLGKSRTVKTNSKGQAKVSTNGLVPKKYTAKITFNGNTKYAKATKSVKVTVKKAKPKLTAKKKTFKGSVKIKKYTVTLKTNKNRAMKNAKLTLKVKGKIYSAKTNAKGKATFKITKLTKKGKFTAVVKFAGNKYYNAKTVKPKITVK
ncbi:Ig-like domain-containing protein [uncultured Methanobrevibacter sp.]|uniref:Ig-like domain-containing protein n=1 Tax=uncultured Methanobrevibacter sp. TaxID=253161 RepID=UPI0025FDCB5B|nr:Ig-like domain-containing protein [uncultured Methanobrevibacter sp.]